MELCGQFLVPPRRGFAGTQWVGWVGPHSLIERGDEGKSPSTYKITCIKVLDTVTMPPETN